MTKKLSEQLRYWRAERPDEWKMDEFIRQAKELEECLSEAVDLMEDIRVGAYKPDSVTTQPWKRILSDNTKDEHA